VRFGAGAQLQLAGISRAAAIVVVLFACVTQLAWAQTTKMASGLYEDEPIGAAVPANSPTTQTAVQTAARQAPPKLVEPQRVILALGIVLGLIFALRWIGRKYFPSIAGPRGHGAVRVLSRTPITPKQQVLLMHVGRRVLVVADNGTQMSPLSEVRDPDEVAQIIGQLTNLAPAGVFESTFSKAQESFEEQVAGRPAVDLSVESNAEPVETSAPDETAESIVAARSEINGLMEKVRGLAQQLGRTS
jgi:flagellar biogenesis protein FliO